MANEKVEQIDSPSTEMLDKLEANARAESFLMYEQQNGVAGDDDDLRLRKALFASENDLHEMNFLAEYTQALEASQVTAMIEARKEVRETVEELKPHFNVPASLPAVAAIDVIERAMYGEAKTGEQLERARKLWRDVWGDD